MEVKDYYRIRKTEKLTNALNTYDKVIPILLLPFVDFLEYSRHLKNLKDYEKIQDEYGEIRLSLLNAKDKDKYREEQLTRWLNDNKEFLNLIELE